MAHLIGYSLLTIATGQEYAWAPSLPWRVEYWEDMSPEPVLRQVNLDKVGLVIPDSAAPEYRLVERWQTDELSDLSPIGGWRQTGWGAPVYNGVADRFEVTGVYEEVPQSELDEQARVQGINDDADRAALIDQLRTATAAQIKNYVTTNVTDLASARAMLTKVILVLARLV